MNLLVLAADDGVDQEEVERLLASFDGFRRRFPGLTSNAEFPA
jgi:hypothetical protein